jgi:malonate transporter
MILTISNALLNITVTLLLGVIAGWHHDFDGKQATPSIGW